jgi:putative protein-disulfide isomerase
MSTLYYIYDPMCSWCYAFAPTWQQIEISLPGAVRAEYVLGGLAPDSDQPMPEAMRAYLRQTWRRIESVVPGTTFNYAFWTDCTPRRSTYPACRAVLAARHFDPEYERPMIAAIQHAYYREARNPSDRITLIALAGSLGIDTDRFAAYVDSPPCHAALAADIERARALGVTGFPSLVLSVDAALIPIACRFGEPDLTLHRIIELSDREESTDMDET